MTCTTNILCQEPVFREIFRKIQNTDKRIKKKKKKMVDIIIAVKVKSNTHKKGIANNIAVNEHSFLNFPTYIN